MLLGAGAWSVGALASAQPGGVPPGMVLSQGPVAVVPLAPGPMVEYDPQLEARLRSRAVKAAAACADVEAPADVGRLNGPGAAARFRFVLSSTGRASTIRSERIGREARLSMKTERCVRDALRAERLPIPASGRERIIEIDFLYEDGHLVVTECLALDRSAPPGQERYTHPRYRPVPGAYAVP